MTPPRGFRRLFRLSSRRGPDAAREVDDEIAAYLALRAEQLVARGWSAEAARAEAERRLGGVEAARQRLATSVAERDAALHRRERLGGLRQDLAYALRQARRGRGFTALAALTIALAVGATTAVFTIVDHVVFRPLPFPEAERLVALASVDSTGEAFPYVSIANWLDWRTEGRSLSGSALYGFQRSFPVGTATGAERVRGHLVSGGFFEVLRPPMLVGRPFTEAEVQEEQPLVVVSEGYWRRVLGADPRLDATLTLFGRPHRVVGVVPARHVYPADAELWVGVAVRAGSGEARNNVSWYAVGRLAPGATAAGAQAELTAVARRIRAEDPVALYSYAVGVTPLQAELLGGSGRALTVLLGAVGLVLLVACANLAGANLARGTARARELSVRVALGAGRARLVQQLLVEQLVLAVAGGVLGVALAWGLVRMLVVAAAGRVPRMHEVALDARVLVFAVAVTLLAALLSGLLPALRLSGRPLRAQLVGGRGVAGGRGAAGLVLVGAEVALALVLLSGAGLLVRSLRSLVSRELGYATEHVLTVDASFAGSTFGDSLRHVAFWDALLGALRGTPGVAAAGAAVAIPFGVAGSGFIDLPGRVDGTIGAGYRVVSDDYFRTLGIPLLAGRAFTAADDRASPRVVVVNRAMAEEFWPGRTPLGERVRARSMEGRADGTPAPWLTVVGVVGDVRHFGFDREPVPEMYVLYRQVPSRAGAVTAVARTTVPPAEVAAEVRRRVRAIDPAVAIELGTLDALVDRSLAERRLPMTVLSGFGALALALAAIGLYSVLSFTVAQRTREIAVRAALGAERGRLLRLVLGQALRVLAAGLAAGLALALLATRSLEALLVDVRPTDPIALASAAAVLLVVGLVAAVVPTRRAMGVDPMLVLRGE